MDPFLVIDHYDNYYACRKGAYSLNQGYVGTSNLDNHYAEFQWNSFILGNSRSRYWKIDEWTKFLPAGSIGYHYDAHTESLTGIEKKVQYLDQKGIDIKNALIVIDKSVLRQIKPVEEGIFMLPPQLVDGNNWLTFQYRHFITFANFDFLKEYFAPTKPEAELTTDDLMWGEYMDYDYTKNEISQTIIEKRIAEGTYYTESLYKSQFEGQQYPDFPSRVYIKEEEKQILQEIARILRKHNTDYRIVISPLYEQSRINPQDLQTLKVIFGEDKVFDFSGANRYSADYHNYYERSHYRPCVASELMKEVYSHQDYSNE